MKSGMRVLLAILVLQAVLISAAVAAGNGLDASAKKKCCGNCQSWSGVYTCDDLLIECGAPTCQKCQPVQTDKGKGKRYMCRDFLPAGCGCKTN